MKRKLEITINGETRENGLCNANIDVKSECYANDYLSIIMALIFRYGKIINTPVKEVLKIIKESIKNCECEVRRL